MVLDSSGVSPKTEEFLYHLLWSAEMLARPTFRNLTDSFENWAYRNGLMRQLASLKRKQLIESKPAVNGDRVYRLTDQGRLRAIGGRDPEAQWNRTWDGQWRLVLFDIPINRNSQRDRLRRYLRDRGFGCLQNSVWVTPDPLGIERQILGDGRINVESLILLDARPCAGESNSDVTSGAWDFARINQRYVRHLKVLDEHPRGRLHNEAAAKALAHWATVERQAWLEAIKIDPLLPACLLPPDYLGQKGWRRRIEVLREAGRQLHTFKIVV